MPAANDTSPGRRVRHDPVVPEFSIRCIVVGVINAETIDGLVRFGNALSDPTRAQVLLELSAAPSYPADLAHRLGVSRQVMSNHLGCLRGCGLVVSEPDGRRSRYELADRRIAAALADLQSLVVLVDPCCAGGAAQKTAAVSEAIS